MGFASCCSACLNFRTPAGWRKLLGAYFVLYCFLGGFMASLSAIYLSQVRATDGGVRNCGFTISTPKFTRLNSANLNAKALFPSDVTCPSSNLTACMVSAVVSFNRNSQMLEVFESDFEFQCKPAEGSAGLFVFESCAPTMFPNTTDGCNQAGQSCVVSGEILNGTLAVGAKAPFSFDIALAPAGGSTASSNPEVLCEVTKFATFGEAFNSDFDDGDQTIDAFGVRFNIAA